MIEEEDYNTLRDSIDSFDNFNNIALAQQLEKHALLEFRRLAAHLYKKNNKWDDSIALSKQDKLFKDAIVTASASNSVEVAEDLLTYFVDIGNKECFAAVLYVCFDLLRSDIVEELSWRHGLNDFYMPYKIQNQRTLVEKVSLHVRVYNKALRVLPFQIAQLEKEVKERSKKEVQKEQQEADMPIINPGFGGPLLLTQGQVGSVGNGFPPQMPPMMANGTGMMPMMTGFPGGY